MPGANLPDKPSRNHPLYQHGTTVNAVFQPGSYVDRQYTIVNSTGGVSGTFNPTVISNMATIQSTFTHDAHGAFLNIRLRFVPRPGVPSTSTSRVAPAPK